jgi:superfamily II DNA/RNA helicase
VNDIRKGVDILSCTSGRLLDFISTRIVKLDQLRYIVLDEADKLLTDKFYEDILQLHNSTKTVRHISPARTNDWLFFCLE